MEIGRGGIHYRRADINDIEVLVDCRVRCLNELYNHLEDDETKILRKALREYFREAIPSNDFVGWLAEYNGRIIATSGMVLWKIPPRYGVVESGKLGYILNFYTIPEARRKGIGTRLLKQLIEEATSLGLRYLHLHASEYGIDLYRKAGFAKPEQVELELRLE
ncbi:MAG: GNAT family N-acetyltransferase [Candidatus Bathyarchaeota archaeon]|nr:MAG: GNAT family N-acetyltransferase [Candidatus Bathyarchaeota archaeon]